LYIYLYSFLVVLGEIRSILWLMYVVHNDCVPTNPLAITTFACFLEDNSHIVLIIILYGLMMKLINYRINGRQTAITRGSRRYSWLINLPSYFVSRSCWIKDSMHVNQCDALTSPCIYIDMSTQDEEERFELMTFISWSVVPNRLSSQKRKRICN